MGSFRFVDHMVRLGFFTWIYKPSLKSDRCKLSYAMYVIALVGYLRAVICDPSLYPNHPRRNHSQWEIHPEPPLAYVSASSESVIRRPPIGVDIRGVESRVIRRLALSLAIMYGLGPPSVVSSAFNLGYHRLRFRSLFDLWLICIPCLDFDNVLLIDSTSRLPFPLPFGVQAALFDFPDPSFEKISPSSISTSCRLRKARSITITSAASVSSPPSSFLAPGLPTHRRRRGTLRRHGSRSPEESGQPLPHLWRIPLTSMTRRTPTSGTRMHCMNSPGEVVRQVKN
jgi:hypothetical protein